jgi:hypothetical protein
MNTIILIVIIAVPVLVVGGLFFFFGFKGHGGQLRNKDWSLDSYSTNMKLDDPPVSGSMVSFKFPNAYPGVHMISKRVSALKPNGSMSITFEITGTKPKFVADGLTPELRLHIGGARLYSLGAYACALQLGTQTLTVPFKPECWKTVDGFQCDYDTAHINQFNQAIAESKMVAFIFGDEHGNGHGAWDENGNTSFRLLKFTP